MMYALAIALFFLCSLMFSVFATVATGSPWKKSLKVASVIFVIVGGTVAGTFVIIFDLNIWGKL